jgi:hypothetical protein
MLRIARRLPHNPEDGASGRAVVFSRPNADRSRPTPRRGVCTAQRTSALLRDGPLVPQCGNVSAMAVHAARLTKDIVLEPI